MRHDPQLRFQIQADVQTLGVREACRKHGVHRATWYRWLAEGISAPPTEMPESTLRQDILDLVAEFPRWGCDRIAFYLQRGGTAVSSPTVQRILLREGLGRRAQRISYAETLHIPKSPRTPGART